MSKEKDHNFVASPPPYVVIPYFEYEKVVKMAHELEEMKKVMNRMDEQYAAIRGMFSECLEKIKEIQDFVKD